MNTAFVSTSSKDKEQLILPDITTTKQIFLESLRSSGKLQYKRYIASPLRYAGGKSLAVGFVAELLPDSVG